MVSIEIARIKVPDVRVSSILSNEQKAFMSKTIQEIGVIQDIVVRDLGDGSYELVAGRSRLQELKDMGVSHAPAKIITADEKLGLIMNIVENVARGSYDYISIAKSIRKLKDMGATSEELERVFPWQKGWIDFIEQLQDLPEDVIRALEERKITPSHVREALRMPTPVEVHEALRSASRLDWNAGTLRTYTQNRLDEIARARAEAAAMGREPEIPDAEPEKLIQYKQCLLCGYKKPVDKVLPMLVCEQCQTLVRYITSQLGSSEDTLSTVYHALKAHLEPRRTPAGTLKDSTGAPAQG